MTRSDEKTEEADLFDGFTLREEVKKEVSDPQSPSGGPEV